MNMKLGLKFLAMIGITLLISISLMMVRGLINERSSRAQEVRSNLAENSAGSQIIAGPYLIVPYVLEETNTNTQKANSNTINKTEHLLIFTPEDLNSQTRLKTEIVKRGLFEAPSYTAKSVMTGFFKPSQEVLTLKKQPINQKIIWQKAYLSLGLQDPKGIREIKASLGNTPLEFEPGHSLNNWVNTATGIHSTISESSELYQELIAQEVSFKIELEIIGTQSLMIDPVGTHSKIDIAGDWPHPSFKGTSPVSRSVTEKSFAATWKTNELARGLTVQACKAEDTNCNQVKSYNNLVGLDFIDPVDRYVLSDRTAKYGELFLILTFAILFLMEVLRSKPIHPMQYALVGFATSVFFLLTLSLSEHVSFFWAYGIAALASVALQSFYAQAVLQHTKMNRIFTGSLIGLYGLLYLILKSEDAALMVGSLAVFAMLAGFMMLTRNVNWYALSQSEKKTDSSTPSF